MAEVAVLGVPDETLGEVATALVVAAAQQPAAAAAAADGNGGGGGDGGGGASEAPAANGADGASAELQRFCRERLAAYQVRNSSSVVCVHTLMCVRVCVRGT